MCVSCIYLFVLHMLVFVLFSSSWCQGLAAVCDYGTPWTFLLTFLTTTIEGSLMSQQIQVSVIASVKCCQCKVFKHQWMQVGIQICYRTVLPRRVCSFRSYVNPYIRG